MNKKISIVIIAICLLLAIIIGIETWKDINNSSVSASPIEEEEEVYCDTVYFKGNILIYRDYYCY